MTRPTIIGLNPDEYNEGLRYYPFMVILHKSDEIFNAFVDLSVRMCIPNKTGDINIDIFNMITIKNK